VSEANVFMGEAPIVYTMPGMGKDGKLMRQRLVQSVALGTLAADTALEIGTKLAIVDDIRMLKSDYWATITGLTAGEAAGLHVYLASGDLTISELEASIEGSKPLQRGDIDETVESEKPIFYLGTFGSNGTDTEAVMVAPGGGHLATLKQRWTFYKGLSWKLFAYNSGVVFTTGATIKVGAQLWGVWIL